MLKLLIADPDINFTARLEEMLRDKFQVITVNNGEDALSCLADTIAPDILLVNLMLKGTHALTILRMLQGNSQHIETIVISPCLDDMIYGQLRACGVKHTLRMPCRPEAVASAIFGVQYSLENGVLTDWNPVHETDKILMSLGFAVGTKRYIAVHHAIIAKYLNPDYVMKQVYVDAAKCCNCSREAVEKAIRDAIKDAFEEGSRQLWRHYCRKTDSGVPNRPGNEEFISGIAARLFTLEQRSSYGDAWWIKAN